MTTEALDSQILLALEKKQKQKVGELAKLLGADRKDVNRCLAYSLAGKVVQDSTYRWSLCAAVPTAQAAHKNPEKPATEINRICHYYLECIGQDSGEGVSVFAASKFGDPDYAELPSLPMSDSSWDWWNTAGVQRLLGKVSTTVRLSFWARGLRIHRALSTSSRI